MKSNIEIANHLMLKSIGIYDISLYHGKMGLVLALYLYARQEGATHISDYAWDLLQEVHKGVNETLPIGLEYGLSGIGYGITLLKKYDIFDCDLNAILGGIDQKIMCYDPRRITDLSFRNGVCGLINYIRLRIEVEGEIKSFDVQYLHELQQKVTTFPVLQNGIPHTTLWNDLHSPDWNLSDFHDKPLGIDEGLAYFLIKNLNLH